MESLHQPAAAAAAVVRITAPLPGRASPPRCHWTEHFVSLSVLTPDWLRGFDRAQEGRPLRLEKKTPPEVSINQREVGGTEREKERRGVEAPRDAQSGRPHQSDQSSRTRARAQPG